MKHWDYYKPRNASVAALRWDENATFSDLNDFCESLVVVDEAANEGQVYDTLTKKWRALEPGDWIVDTPTGLTPMPHERFVQLYEQDTDGSKPRGND